MQNYSFKYALFNQAGTKFRITSFDDDLTINTKIIFMENYAQSQAAYSHFAYMKNDIIYFSYTINYISVDGLTTNFQTTTTLLNSDFNSNTWEIIMQQPYNPGFNIEVSIGNGYNPELFYSIIYSNIQWVNYQKPENISSYDVFANTTIVDMESWIWSRFDTSFTQCSFPLPEFVLGSEYIVKIGNKLYY